MNVVVTPDRRVSIALDDILGSFRSFGSHGPVYEVLRTTEPPTGPDAELTVRVVESGEVLSYPLAEVLADPLA